MTFRRKISDIVGMSIPENGWDSVFAQLNAIGRLDQKNVYKILLEVCKAIDEQQNIGVQSDK